MSWVTLPATDSVDWVLLILGNFADGFWGRNMYSDIMVGYKWQICKVLGYELHGPGHRGKGSLGYCHDSFMPRICFKLISLANFIQTLERVVLVILWSCHMSQLPSKEAKRSISPSYSQDQSRFTSLLKSSKTEWSYPLSSSKCLVSTDRLTHSAFTNKMDICKCSAHITSWECKKIRLGSFLLVNGSVTECLKTGIINGNVVLDWANILYSTMSNRMHQLVSFIAL